MSDFEKGEGTGLQNSTLISSGDRLTITEVKVENAILTFQGVRRGVTFPGWALNQISTPSNRAQLLLTNGSWFFAMKLAVCP